MYTHQHTHLHITCVDFPLKIGEGEEKGVWKEWRGMGEGEVEFGLVFFKVIK